MIFTPIERFEQKRKDKLKRNLPKRNCARSYSPDQYAKLLNNELDGEHFEEPSGVLYQDLLEIRSKQRASEIFYHQYLPISLTQFEAIKHYLPNEILQERVEKSYSLEKQYSRFQRNHQNYFNIEEQEAWHNITGFDGNFFLKGLIFKKIRHEYSERAKAIDEVIESLRNYL